MATGVAVSVQSAGTLPEPDAAASTILVRVRWAGWSLLLIVQVAETPWWQDQDSPRSACRRARPGAGRVSGRAAGLRQGVGAGVHRSVGDRVGPGAPLIGVGPAAVRVQAVGIAVPPLSLVTVLTRVSVAGWSSLLIVQVAVTPGEHQPGAGQGASRARPGAGGVAGRSAGLRQRVGAGVRPGVRSRRRIRWRR